MPKRDQHLDFGRPSPSDTVLDEVPERELAQETSSLLPGKRVAKRFLLEKELGSGTSATVFAALDTKTNERVALKVIHERLVGSQMHHARFEREAIANSRIEHPHIVQLREQGLDEIGRAWHALEYLEGIDMDRVIERGPMTPKDAIRIGLQLLAALRAVHERGYVHRDVKPLNIFLRGWEEGDVFVKLLDFGIAKPIVPTDSQQPLTARGAVLGTPHYMAPEQISSEVPVGPRTDLWATAAVLFTALAGRPPFEEKALARLLVRIAREPAPSVAFFRPDVPTSLAEVLATALRTNPYHRYETAKEMAKALQKVQRTL